MLTHREQAALVKAWIQQRFDVILPALMQREKIDMWIIVSREYSDDPVFRSMAPLTTYSSRRRTILVFHQRGGKVERLSVGRFDYDGLYTVVPTANDAQWSGLQKLVEERDPQVIGINTSEAWNHADGLTANEKDNLLKALGPKYAARARSAEMLAVGWLESKLPVETEAYRHVIQVAHRVMDLTMKHASAGGTGNQALVAALRDARAEGLTPSIYCHPVGYHVGSSVARWLGSSVAR